MQLFYAPDIVPPLHTLNEEESKHCIRVLRLQCGGRIHITDGRGNLFCCEITDEQSPALHRAGRQRRNRVRKTALRADDGRRADQEFGAFRMVFGKSHRGGRHGRRAAGNGTQRTPGLQARAGREGRHRGVETVAQGLPPRAASAHPLPRSGAVGPRGAEVHRPPAPRRSRPPGKAYLARALRPGRDGPRSSSVPKATSRPAKSPSRWPTVSKRSPSDDSVCAPRPRPSRRWSWHRWSTVKNTINF